MSDRTKRIKFTIKMQKKLVVLFGLVLLAFVGLSYRLFIITRDNGERYKKQVLSQQKYDSITLPYKRGSILDANGTVLASSEKVYNVILDAVAVSRDESYLEPTLEALRSQIGADVQEVRAYIAANSETSRYRVLARRLEFDQIKGLMELINEENSKVQGIWFENEYKRTYPGGSLACDLLGFTTNDNVGSYGLEEYYNDILSGTPGREYGYMNNDSNVERTTIPAVDGNSLVTTIDANIQSIVEKHLKKFNEEYKDNFHEGNGANNVGCIMMDVNSGEILAMASYPSFDLNDTRNLSALIGMPMLDEEGKRTGEYVNEENLSQLESDVDVMYRQLNALWKNFCISETYEPGSVSKPITVAAGIESGSITGNETYNCNGFLEIGGHEISCHSTWGDGPLTVAEGIERSCNVNMMYVASATGVENFTKFQHNFNFGLKTNIDLAGESRTDTLIYDKNSMHVTELATCSFGQGYNCTMIQMMSAFCSVINGGYYYEPHVVKKIVSPSGATVQNIEPRILRQTISETTSDKVREMCNLVVSGEKGTGKTARPAGYMIGGKTGTAETVPRSAKEYVVSFLGYAPVDDPQVAIYVVVDRPNVTNLLQADAKFATKIVRSILTEVLPYMGIYMTEELSESEMEELEALQIELMTPPEPIPGEEGDTQGEGTEGEGGDVSGEGSGEGEQPLEGAEEGSVRNEPWKDFPIDPATGYAVDPATGNYVDPDTGAVLGLSYESGDTGSNPAADPSPTAAGGLPDSPSPSPAA